MSEGWRRGSGGDGAFVYIEVDFDPTSARHGINRAHKRALVGNRYKLIVDELAQTTELYDLREDPGESLDLSSQRPDLVRRLESEIEKQRRAAGTPARAGSATR